LLAAGTSFALKGADAPKVIFQHQLPDFARVGEAQDFSLPLGEYSTIGHLSASYSAVAEKRMNY